MYSSLSKRVYVDQPMSDHSTITAEVNLAVRQHIELVRRVKRCWRTFNAEEFVQDVERSSLVQHPPSNVNELFALYNTLRSALDEHAPRKVSNIRAVFSSGTTLRGTYRKDQDASPRENPPTDEDRRVARSLPGTNSLHIREWCSNPVSSRTEPRPSQRTDTTLERCGRE